MTHHFTSPSGRCRFVGIVHEFDGETWVRTRDSLRKGSPGLSEEPGAPLSRFTRGGWTIQPPLSPTAASRTAAREHPTRSRLTSAKAAGTPADAGAA